MINYLIALLLYLPTTLFVETYIYVAFVFVFIFLHRKKTQLNYQNIRKSAYKYFNNFQLIVGALLILMLFINSLIGGVGFLEFITGPVLLFPLTLMAAFLISNVKTIRLLVLLICIEICIAFIQYMLGMSSFFSFLPKYKTFSDYSLLYNTRVFGLSENSSFLAQKCLVLILILYRARLKMPKYLFIIAMVLGVLGTVVTFGRTILICLLYLILFFSIRYFWRVFKKRKYDNYQNVGIALFIALFSMAFFLFTQSFWTNQFSREGLEQKKLDNKLELSIIEGSGIDKIEMAGRQQLWLNGINFVIENPLLGNNTHKYSTQNKHVHNSFLEFTATNGIICMFLMLILIISAINASNVQIVTTVMLYSVAQYGIFWDISFLDILFYAYLFFEKKINYTYRVSREQSVLTRKAEMSNGNT